MVVVVSLAVVVVPVDVMPDVSTVIESTVVTEVSVLTGTVVVEVIDDFPELVVESDARLLAVSTMNWMSR